MKNKTKNPAASALGSLGGKATMKKHGKKHMQRISRDYWQKNKKHES